jgi:hypothetical protein
MFQLAPYCAEYEIAITNASGTIVLVSPRRPIDELTQWQLRKLLPAGVFFVSIAIYNHCDRDLHEYRRWLEGRRVLNHNLVMKKRPSRQYKKLYDALLVPCKGSIAFRLTADGKWTTARNQERTAALNVKRGVGQ